MTEIKKNSPSQLAKTQKIIFLDSRLTNLLDRNSQARKLVEEYWEIEKALRFVKKRNILNPLIFLLIKKRLAGLVQQEFELYKSFPELVKKENKTKSTEIVSSIAQAELSEASKAVYSKLNNLMKEGILKRKYMREVYTYKLPPVRMPAKTKKFKSVFTSSAMKKKFS